jgi:hypothetical protein
MTAAVFSAISILQTMLVAGRRRGKIAFEQKTPQLRGCILIIIL